MIYQPVHIIKWLSANERIISHTSSAIPSLPPLAPFDSAIIFSLKLSSNPPTTNSLLNNFLQEDEPHIHALGHISAPSTLNPLLGSSQAATSKSSEIAISGPRCSSRKVRLQMARSSWFSMVVVRMLCLGGVLSWGEWRVALACLCGMVSTARSTDEVVWRLLLS